MRTGKLGRIPTESAPRHALLSSISAIALSAALLAAGSQSALAVSCVTGVTSSNEQFVQSLNLSNATVTGDPAGATSASALTNSDTSFAGSLFGFPVGTSKDLSDAIAFNLIPGADVALQTTNTSDSFIQSLPSGVSVVDNVTTNTAAALTSVTAQYSGANDGSGVGNPQVHPSNTACGTNASTAGSSQFSSAFGTNSQASGFESTAIGGAAEATGRWSTATGVLANAQGDFSTAMGVLAQATGEGAIAIGADPDGGGGGLTGAQAQGAYSTVVGVNSTAGGTNDVIMGRNNNTGGDGNNTVVGNGITYQQRVSKHGPRCGAPGRRIKQLRRR